MLPWIHQTSLAKKGYEILKKHAILYLAMEERTGKSLVGVLIAEQASVIKILVVTKTKAFAGWEETFAKFKHNKVYLVTTYTQISKLDDEDWDLIILDEAHNYISSFPNLPGVKMLKGRPVKGAKPGVWQIIRRFTRRKPIIYMSATPHAQSLSQLYHQFALSDWTPWKFHDFKSWHRSYGVPYKQYINGREIAKYDRTQDAAVLASVEHLFITTTRKELDFTYEPIDKLHWINLSDNTREHYNMLLKEKIHTVGGGSTVIACDTPGKLRPALHMLEGGVAKATVPGFGRKGEPKLIAKYFVLKNTEKVDYILDHWGDNESVVIMYNYIAEETKLKQHFKKAQILQATSNAEGVDLSNYETLIVYSQDFSTARHTQRRARQANKNRDTPIVVHFLLVKKGLSEEVYNTVSLNKQNYVDCLFKRNKV